MAHQEIKGSLHDVAFTTATPFTEDASTVDHAALESNLEWIADAGANLFIPCGNTGEYDSLTTTERVDVVRTHVETVGNQGTVIAGAGGSKKAAANLIREYESIGVDGVMLMQPSHTFIHERGLVKYYQSLANATELPFILYKRRPSLTGKILNTLSHQDNIVGVKYALNDIKDFSRSVAEVPVDLVWIDGVAERYAPTFHLEGARGYTTGIGNFLPEATLALFDALQSDEYDRARSIRDLVRPLEDLREEPGTDNAQPAANNVPVVKYGLDLAGNYGGPVRDPLVELSDTDKRRTEEYYERVQSSDHLD